MMNILKQVGLTLLISSVLAFNGLAVSSTDWQDKKGGEKPKEQPKKDPPKDDKPKDDKKNDKKKPD